MDDDCAVLLEAYRRSREDAALETLVSRLHPEAYRFAHRMLGDPAAAEDAAQDALISLVRGVDRFDPRRPFRPWWGAILANAVRMAGRARRRTLRREERAAAARPESTPARTGERLERDELAEHVRRLPVEVRLPIVLHYWEGHGHEEVAAILGWPKGTASTRIRRGIERLRVSLGANAGAAAVLSVEAIEEALRAAPPAPVAALPPAPSAVALKTKLASIALRALFAKVASVLAAGALVGTIAAGTARHHRAPASSSSFAATSAGAAKGELVALVPAGAESAATPREEGAHSSVAPTGDGRAPRESAQPSETTSDATAPPLIRQPVPAAEPATPTRSALASLRGRATLDGRPLCNARLHGSYPLAPAPQSEGSSETPMRGHFEASSDREGFYAVCDLEPAGAPTLKLTLETTGAAMLHCTVELRPGATLEQDLAFESRATLEGRLVLPAGTDPETVGLWASLKEQSSAQSTPTTISGTAIEGRYRFTDLDPGTYFLVAELEGYAGAKAEAKIEHGGRIEGPEIRIGAGVVVSGRVLFSDGRPAPEQKVELGSTEVNTDEQGVFRIRGVAPGDYELRVFLGTPRDMAGGLVFPEVERLITVGETNRDLGDIRFHPAPDMGTVRGRVLGPDGAPVTGARVACVVCNGHNPVDAVLGNTWSTTSDEGGRFECEVEAGRCRIAADSGNLVLDDPICLTIAPDTTATADLRLVRGGSIHGRVTSLPSQQKGARLIAHILLSAGPALLGELSPVSLSPDGEFTFEGLPTGRYDVTVGFNLIHSWHATRTVEVRAGAETTAELALDLAGALRVEVAGLPPALGTGAEVLVKVSGRGPLGFNVREPISGGHAEFPSVPPGPAHVSVLLTSSSLGDFWLERTVEVPRGGEPVQVSFQWPGPDEAGAIEGSLDGPAGEARALVVASDEFRADHWVSEDATSFRIAPLMPGRYRLVRRDRAFPPGTGEGVEVVVPRGGVARLAAPLAALAPRDAPDHDQGR